MLLTILSIAVAIVIGAWQIYLAYKQLKQNESTKSPKDKKGNLETRNSKASKLPPLSKQSIVKLSTEPMETVFYHVVQHEYEVGGVLIGHFAKNEVFVKRAVIGFETDFSRIDLASDENVVGFWHSHRGLGVHFTGNDVQQMMKFPKLISVIVDPLSKDKTIGAFGIIKDKPVEFQVITQ